MDEQKQAPADHVVDRAGWEPGPWDGEPDRVEWRSLGLACLIVRSNVLGALCGYVGVPPGHPWHRRGYGDLDNSVDVHGGLSYSDSCFDAICHVPQPGESDDVWWLGFDCGHAFDRAPGMEAKHRKYDVPFSFMGREVYRDVAYVRAEVEQLAEQAVAASLGWAQCAAARERRKALAAKLPRYWQRRYRSNGGRLTLAMWKTAAQDGRGGSDA